MHSAASTPLGAPPSQLPCLDGSRALGDAVSAQHNGVMALRRAPVHVGPDLRDSMGASDVRLQAINQALSSLSVNGELSPSIPNHVDSQSEDQVVLKMDGATDEVSFTLTGLVEDDVEDPIVLCPIVEAAKLPNTTLSVFVRTNPFIVTSRGDRQYATPHVYAGSSYLSWNLHAEASPTYDGYPRDPLTNLPVEYSDFFLSIDGFSDCPIVIGALENKPLEAMSKPLKLLLRVMKHYSEEALLSGLEVPLGQVKQLAMAAMLMYGPGQLYGFESPSNELNEADSMFKPNVAVGLVLAAALHRNFADDGPTIEQIYNATQVALMDDIFVNEADSATHQAVKHHLDALRERVQAMVV